MDPSKPFKNNVFPNMAPPSAWGSALNDTQFATNVLANTSNTQAVKMQEATRESKIAIESAAASARKPIEAEAYGPAETEVKKGCSVVVTETSVARDAAVALAVPGDGSDTATAVAMDVERSAERASKQRKRKEREIDEEECVEHWQREALRHFKNSAWREVIPACRKVLEVPGQPEKNFDVLFEMGYSYMRLDDCRAAAKCFSKAHRVGGNKNKIALRVVMGELKRKMGLRGARMRRRSGERPLSSSMMVAGSASFTPMARSRSSVALGEVEGSNEAWEPWGRPRSALSCPERMDVAPPERAMSCPAKVGPSPNEEPLSSPADKST